jgi:hypothetical protein
MKATIKLTLIVIGVVVLSLTMLGSAMAATNEALDGGGGGILLGNSGTVEVTSTQLGLVKKVFDSAGACLASSPADGGCNGGATTVSVLTGTRLTMVIYVDNTTVITGSDIRFIDNVDDDSGAGDYFQFQTQFTTNAACLAGQGLSFGTLVSTGATIADIYNAATGGTCLTNALDGAAQVNEYAGISGTNPAVLEVGGDNASPDNDQVNVAGDTIWAIAFDVIKLDN